MNDLLPRLSAWYSAQCNDDWEHQYGVTIGTLDNPGWSLRIDLNGTNLNGCDFSILKIERTANNWVQCRIAGQKFEGFGGPENLSELIEVFLSWAESKN
jgi:Immunity protein 53